MKRTEKILKIFHSGSLSVEVVADVPSFGRPVVRPVVRMRIVPNDPNDVYVLDKSLDIDCRSDLLYLLWQVDNWAGGRFVEDMLRVVQREAFVGD